MHPATAGLLKFFTHDHLPEHLAVVSKPFCELAHSMATSVDEGGLGCQGAELTAGLRKILEAKDCAVRAVLS